MTDEELTCLQALADAAMPGPCERPKRRKA
jgi:hypothetical protein